MIERIERQYSYSLNRYDLPLAVCPEPDEALEFRQIRIPLPRRRVVGEALVKFGPPNRDKQKPSLAPSSSPFDLLPRQAKIPGRVTASSLIAASKFDGQLPATLPIETSIDETAIIAPSAKMRPYVGQELLLDSKRAIITWLGNKKFEVIIAGLQAKERFKFSEYPDLRRGKSRINRMSREPASAAS